MSPVTTAVVPVAGLGTRLHPATIAVPKVLLPVGGRPVVEHVVDELVDDGIERIVFVTGHGTEVIEQHFASSGRHGVQFAYVRQPQPRGLGDAVGCAEALVGDAPFAVALGDAILGTREPAGVVARLARAFDEHGAACAIAVREVPRDATGRYGIVVTDRDAELARVTAIVEKPAPRDAPSTLAVSARYVLSPEIFTSLRATPTGRSGELELTDAIAALVADGSVVVALRLGELVRHDVGTHESYAKAVLAYALTDPEHGDVLRAEARQLLDGPR